MCSNISLRTFFNKIKFRKTVDYKNKRKTERRFGVILAPFSEVKNVIEKIIYAESNLFCFKPYFLYKLSFLLHSLLDNGAKMIAYSFSYPLF